MDVSSSLFQLQDNSEFLLDCENFLEQSFSASDAGYYSACSSLSPASSTDSCCFSPPGQDAFPKSFNLKTDGDQEDKKKAKAPKRTGRPRSKFPGVKRQNASEREKLRMRDLTKALHHLRNYLPPSVAPAGQTLTKIETLRLTINYINYLSAQLELGQEEASQMNLSPPVQDTPTLPVNQVAPQTQSFSTQEFLNMPYYESPDHVSLPSSMALSQSQEFPSSSTASMDNSNYGQSCHWNSFVQCKM